MKMIKVDPCRGCGRLLYSASLGGLTYRAETEPLNAQEATQHLLGGGELYRVTQTSVSSATPAVLTALRQRGTTEGPTVVRRHVCPVKAQEAVSAPNPAPVTRSPQPTPQRPPAGRTTRSSGPSAAPSSVRSAEHPPSEDGPRCDDCGLIMEEGDYVSAQLGSIYIWAAHLVNCVA